MSRLGDGRRQHPDPGPAGEDEVVVPDGPVPRRIHVVGGEATGKTTVARRIGELLELPVTNLDAVTWRTAGDGPFEVWDPRYQPSAAVVLRPLEERIAIARDLAARDGWVTEGKHVGWTDPLLERAEVVVWLDHVGPVVALVRILRRAVRSAVREAGRRRGRDRFARFRDYAVHGRELLGQLWRRVRYVSAPMPGGTTDGDDPDAVTRTDIERAVAPHRDRLVHVRRDEDLARLLARLEAGARPR